MRYYYFLASTGLDKFIKETLKGLNTKNLKELERVGKLIREKMVATEFPDDLNKDIVDAYRNFIEKRYGKNADVAVRSSATAEDLPGASFAGEQESYLGIRGAKAVCVAVRATMASLFTDRAISYRADRGFDHLKIALSAGVQKMVRSDKACSGVMFSVDTESGFPNIVIINGSWGLGEMIVKGEVTPDEFIIWKDGLKNGHEASDHRAQARRKVAQDDLSSAHWLGRCGYSADEDREHEHGGARHVRADGQRSGPARDVGHYYREALHRSL